MKNASGRRLADFFHLLAALTLLAAVLVFFELPLRALVAKAGQGGNPLAGLFGPASGFLARIGSQPSGARIHIDGKDRGETPFFGNVACSQGEKVKIEIEAPGFRLWQRELECRENGQLEIDAKLLP